MPVCPWKARGIPIGAIDSRYWRGYQHWVIVTHVFKYLLLLTF